MRRGQIKMFESIGVLVVFFFLLVIGAVFYFKLQESALNKELQQQSQLRSLQTAQRAVFLAELDCSFVSVTRENCIDVLKLNALAELMTDTANRQQYFGLFGFARVTVSQVYPAAESIELYTNPPEEYVRALVSRLPVLVYDPVAKDFAFGIMEVTTYAER